MKKETKLDRKMLNFDEKKLKTVKIEQIKPNKYNPKEHKGDKYLKVLESIKVNGLMSPVFVREISKDHYEVIDGEQRFHACEDLNYKEVLIYNYGEIDDLRAKELTIWWQEQVPFDELKLAELFADMINSVAGDYTKIKLPFTNEEIEEKIEMLKFDWNSIEEEAQDKDEGHKDAIKCPHYGEKDCYYYEEAEENKKAYEVGFDDIE